MDTIKTFTDYIKIWGKEHFGNIIRDKKILLARLNSIQKSPHYNHSFFLQELEEDLLKHYNNILKLEEDYWKLKSRINWLNERDANTRFFQISTSNRKRQNHISFFRNSEGAWLDNHQDILNHTLEHFTSLFTTSHTYTNWTHMLHSSTSFHNVDLTPLDNALLDSEINTTIFSFMPFKSPGPDVLHPF